MRRYYQATLAIVAIISVISLLFYRHEYNKLRYVLEVFNYFGKPNGKSAQVSCKNVNETIFINQQQSLNEPINSWQRLRDDLYVYSAYSINFKEIHLISLGVRDSEFRLACDLFFDNQNEPLRTTFRYVAIDKFGKEANYQGKSSFVGYRFICTYESGEEPVGVRLIADGNNDPLEDVIIPVRRRPKTSGNNGSVICVLPSQRKPIVSNDVLTFLGFHHLIGIKYFFLYDFGISSLVADRLENLASSPVNTHSRYTNLPWNFPFTDVPRDVVRDIVQEDCLYRSYGKALFAVTLSWEEFIVPKYHNTIYDLVVDFSKTRLQADRYKLQTRTFCTKIKQEPFDNTTISIFKNTYFDPSISQSRTIYIEKPDRILQSTKGIVTREIRQDLICVNRYIPCNDSKINHQKKTHDPSILRFTNSMYNLNIFHKSSE